MQWAVFSRMLRDSSPRFVHPLVGRSVGPSHFAFLCSLFFDLTASAQMIWWPQIWPLPTRTQLRQPCIRPCLVISFNPQVIHGIFHLSFTWHWESLQGFIYLSVFVCPSLSLLICLSFFLSFALTVFMSVDYLHKHLNTDYDNLGADASLYCSWSRSMRENYKFDLTTFGFNDQKSLVPSRSLNQVPTV